MTLPLFNIGGLASGLDTASMISSLLQVERIPIGQLNARTAQFTAKNNAWQSISNRYGALRTALDAVSSLDKLAKMATTAISTNPGAVSATSTATATPGSVTFTVDRLATSHQAVSDTAFASGNDTVGAGTFVLTVAGSDHEVVTTADTTLNELVQQINGLGVGVTASTISVDGTVSKLYLASTATGAAGSFTTGGTVGSPASTSVVQAGQDAQLTLGSGPGALSITRPTNVLTDLLPGVTIGLNAVTSDPVTISTGRDVTAVAAAITKVVDEVNATLTTIGTLTAYNASANSGGVLAGDRTARHLVIALRSAISATVSPDSTDHPIAASIGISLDRTGKFTIDAAKLRGALESDFEGVTGLLVGADGGGGVLGAVKNHATAAAGAGGEIARARDMWHAQIDSAQKRIDILEDRVERRESQLIRQFAGLEVAMSSLTAQSAWLTAQLAALGGNTSK